MNITIDKNYTVAGRMDYVKSFIKEFKRSYNDCDIARILLEDELLATSFSNVDKVLTCDIEVFNTSCGVENEQNTLQIDLYVLAGIHMYHAHCYTNESLHISNDNCTRFEIYDLRIDTDKVIEKE